LIEIKAYFAVILLMGIARLPAAVDHWGPFDLFTT